MTGPLPLARPRPGRWARSTLDYHAHLLLPDGDHPPGVLKARCEGRNHMSSYLIIIEGDGSTNYLAYCPDLPGVVATGDSIDECSVEMRDAIAFHIAGLHEAELPVPPPTSQGRTVEVAA